VGALPLDLKKLAYDEVLRRLRDQDAPRPSTMLRMLGESSAVTAKNRGVDPPTLARQLRGDPDAITLKALEKDRKRRYASASDLAEDIGRYLRNEPVAAQPPSASYRARKYLRRHRLGVAMAGAGLLLLGRIRCRAGGGVAAHLRRARPRRSHLAVHDQNVQSVQPQPGARQCGDGAGNSRQSVLGHRYRAEGRSGIAGEMMFTMAQTYEGLGLYPQTQSLLERALAIQQRTLGPRNPETLRTMTLLAECVGTRATMPKRRSSHNLRSILIGRSWAHKIVTRCSPRIWWESLCIARAVFRKPKRC